jgi:flagellar biosynthetic protein FlhB
MAEDQGKTEKPTPRKLRKARQEGQFPRTQDVGLWLAVIAASAMLPRTAELLTQDVREGFARLGTVGTDPSPARALQALGSVPGDVLLTCAPVAGAAVAAAVLGTAAQGVHPTTKTLVPKFSRLSPKQGVKRMFGVRSAWEAVKSLTKVLVIGMVMLALARSLMPALLAGSMHLGAVIDRTRGGLQTMLWSVALAGLVMAGADYAFQRRTVMKQLRMTPREIRDEAKQTEGDPQLKSAIRSRQMAISRNRMLSQVAHSDVVLVNPTHYAVALKYEPAKGAPRVVAKGVDALALKIRRLAHDNRVPVVEDKPLTRTLYRICDLDEEIPAELYLAVARILAFVMAAGKPSRWAGTSRPPSAATRLPDLPAKAVLRARQARQARQAREASRQSRQS